MKTLDKLVLCTAMVLGPISGCTGKSSSEVRPEPITTVSEVKAPAICASEIRLEIGTYGKINADYQPTIYCVDKDKRNLVCGRNESKKYVCFTLQE